MAGPATPWSVQQLQRQGDSPIPSYSTYHRSTAGDFKTEDYIPFDDALELPDNTPQVTTLTPKKLVGSVNVQHALNFGFLSSHKPADSNLNLSSLNGSQGPGSSSFDRAAPYPRDNIPRTLQLSAGTSPIIADSEQSKADSEELNRLRSSMENLKVVSRKIQILSFLQNECPEDWSAYNQNRLDWLRGKSVMVSLGTWTKKEEKKDPSKHQHEYFEPPAKRIRR